MIFCTFYDSFKANFTTKRIVNKCIGTEAYFTKQKPFLKKNRF